MRHAISASTPNDKGFPKTASPVTPFQKLTQSAASFATQTQTHAWHTYNFSPTSVISSGHVFHREAGGWIFNKLKCSSRPSCPGEGEWILPGPWGICRGLAQFPLSFHAHRVIWAACVSELQMVREVPQRRRVSSGFHNSVVSSQVTLMLQELETKPPKV